MARWCVTRELGPALAVARRIQPRYTNSLTLSACQQIHRFIPFSSIQEVFFVSKPLISLDFLLGVTSSFRHDQNCWVFKKQKDNADLRAIMPDFECDLIFLSCYLSLGRVLLCLMHYHLMWLQICQYLMYLFIHHSVREPKFIYIKYTFPQTCSWGSSDFRE